jgi:Helix-turn-helix.
VNVLNIEETELGMSQAELCARAGFKSRTAISKIEKGERETKQSKILQIAIALECDPAWLLGIDKQTLEQKIEQMPQERKELVLELINLMEDLTPDELRQALDSFKFILYKRKEE